MLPEWLTLFTNYEIIDLRYHWIRGAIWGFVLATIIWKLAVPYIREKWEDN